MLTHLLRLTLRQFRRNAAFGLLTVGGLAVGIAACLVIFLYVQEEAAFDRFHERADRLYRLDKVVTPKTGGSERHAITSAPMGPALAAQYPEVDRAIRVLPWFDEVLLRQGDTSVRSSDFVFADSTFFEAFSFALVRGDPGAVLAAPMSAVLTESTARRLYGGDDPVGQSFVGLNDFEYRVTGIAADPPAQSHLRFDAVIAFSSLEPGRGGLDMGWVANWYPQAFFTYLLLGERAEPAAFEAKLAGFMERNMPDRADQYALYLQPLSDIYLGSAELQYTSRTLRGNRLYVRVLSLAAVLILVIAAINFVNMGTARATRRAHEVGVRKAVGAGRGRLVSQFLGENLLVAFLGLLVAVLLVASVLPSYRAFTGNTLPFGVWTNAPLVALIGAIWAVVGLGAGAYPALYLSRLSSTKALRGGAGGGVTGGRLRRVLVATQFAVSIVLIAGTATIWRQTAYMQGKDLGFAKDRMVVLQTGSTGIAERFEAFRTALEAYPGVLGTAGSNSVPGMPMMGFGINPEGKSQDETWTSSAIRLEDFDLIDVYGMRMAAGRNFSPDRPSDYTGAIVINEALARSLGWSNDAAVGRRIDVPGEVDRATVIGVVRDFHFESLRQSIEPLFLYYAPRGAMLSVRLRGDDIAGSLDHIRATWRRFDPVYPFDYSFLDQDFARLYEAEESLMAALGLFGMLAIVVACLGLFGLAAFAAEQRTKEIGVRKVLGASVSGLVSLLSREVVRIVAAAVVVAVPVAWFLASRWLDGFAFRVEGVGWTIALAGVATLVLAVVSVSWQALQAANADPVRSLRHE